MNITLNTIERHLKRERLLAIAVCSTLLSLIPTAYVAFISNSTTLLADLLRCLGEFLAIVASWLVLRKMSRADPERFNYGYGKLEQLAGIGVAAALFITFLVALFCGVRGLIFPERLENGEMGFIFGVASVLGNVTLWISNFITNRRSPSPITESQWRLFRAKTMASLVVVLSLGTALLFSDYAFAAFVDPIGSIALSMFMLWQSYTLVSASVPDLIDYAIEESLQGTLKRVIADHRGEYVELMRVRSRRTPRTIYIEVLIAFDGALTFATVHASAAKIRAALEDNFPNADVNVIPSLGVG